MEQASGCFILGRSSQKETPLVTFTDWAAELADLSFEVERLSGKFCKRPEAHSDATHVLGLVTSGDSLWGLLRVQSIWSLIPQSVLIRQ